MTEPTQKQSKTEKLLEAILAEVQLITADIAKRNAEREIQSRPIETAFRR